MCPLSTRLIRAVANCAEPHSETVQENNAVLKRIESSLRVGIDEWAGCKPIYFIDALERRRICSFELCDTWEVLSPPPTIPLRSR